MQSVFLSFIKLQQISWFHPNVLWSILKPINYFSDALLNSVYVWDSLHISAGKGHKYVPRYGFVLNTVSAKWNYTAFYPI